MNKVNNLSMQRESFVLERAKKSLDDLYLDMTGNKHFQGFLPSEHPSFRPLLDAAVENDVANIASGNFPDVGLERSQEQITNEAIFIADVIDRAYHSDGFTSLVAARAKVIKLGRFSFQLTVANIAKLVFLVGLLCIIAAVFSGWIRQNLSELYCSAAFGWTDFTPTNENMCDGIMSRQDG